MSLKRKAMTFLMVLFFETNRNPRCRISLEPLKREKEKRNR